MAGLGKPAPARQRWLLTGAGGWFGKTALYEYEQSHGPGALREQVVAFASKPRWIDFGSAHGPIQALDLRDIRSIEAPTGLLHLAFLTRDRIAQVGLNSYISTNREITAAVREVLQANPTIPAITTSSGAAAALDGLPANVEANPYASLKQEEEALWREEAQQRMAVVFRVYAASGRMMVEPERFALGDLLLQALAGQQLHIKARHRVERSYVHVGSLMQLAWAMLKQPKPNGFYGVDACVDRIDLLELAQTISHRFGLMEPSHAIDPELPVDRYGGDGQIFAQLLKDYRLIHLTLEDQIADTLAGLLQQAKLTRKK